jgi:RNA polymerase sigma factor (sigma-70 family)
MEGMMAGDTLALAQLTRLINGFLRRWNAYDFRDDWDDLIQEVLLAAGQALREGRIRKRKSLVAFLRATTRHKFADRLRRHLRCREGDTRPWDEVVAGPLEPVDHGTSRDSPRDVNVALEQLPEKVRTCVVAVYVEGLRL